MQLYLDYDNENAMLAREVQRLQELCERYRKATFAKIVPQNKQLQELKERLEILERNICQNR